MPRLSRLGSMILQTLFDGLLDDLYRICDRRKVVLDNTEFCELL